MRSDLLHDPGGERVLPRDRELVSNNRTLQSPQSSPHRTGYGERVALDYR
jgi:hypothetical protein